jgi:hypothetical protein
MQHIAQNSKMKNPQPYAEAKPQVIQFRDEYAAQVPWVTVFSLADLQHYVNILQEQEALLNNNPDKPANAQLMLGVYSKVQLNNHDANQVSIVTAPVWQLSEGGIVDFFNDDNNAAYLRVFSGGNYEEQIPAYNEGSLEP